MWGDAWGTSIAAPSWAALIAIANQGRTALNEQPLNGNTQTLPTLYSLAGTSAFNLISSATNGTAINPLYNPSSAVTLQGTDNTYQSSVGSTGLGSPAANVLVPALVGAGTKQVLYWDPQHMLSGAGSGGSGAWNTTSLNWFNGVADVAWSNASNAIAVFAGSSGGTVTLGKAITADSLEFNTSGYTLKGSTLTLSGVNSWPNPNPSPTTNSLVGGNVYVLSGMSETLGSIVAGATGMVLTGGGALTLNGTNTYSGGTTVNDNSTLNISADANLGAAPASAKINVILGDGATLQTTGSLSLNSKRKFLTVSATLNSSGSLTIGGALMGADSLTLSGSGSLIFQGQVGNAAYSPDILQTAGAVSFLSTTDLNGATFMSNVVLGGNNTSFTSAGSVVFGSNSSNTLTVDGNGTETIATLGGDTSITINATTTASENLTFNLGTGTFTLNSNAAIDLPNYDLTIIAGTVNPSSETSPQYKAKKVTIFVV